MLDSRKDGKVLSDTATDEVVDKSSFILCSESTPTFSSVPSEKTNFTSFKQTSNSRPQNHAEQTNTQRSAPVSQKFCSVFLSNDGNELAVPPDCINITALACGDTIPTNSSNYCREDEDKITDGYLEKLNYQSVEEDADDPLAVTTDSNGTRSSQTNEKISSLDQTVILCER